MREWELASIVLPREAPRRIDAVHVLYGLCAGKSRVPFRPIYMLILSVLDIPVPGHSHYIPPQSLRLLGDD